MVKTRDQGRKRLRGAAQLGLFAREELLACGDPGSGVRSSHARTAVEEIAEPDVPRAGGFQMVALWHDRSWAPLRVFRRGDDASVVVFKVA